MNHRILSPTSYDQIHRREITLAGRKFVIFTKPGLPTWGEIPPAFELLAKSILLVEKNRVLLFGSGVSILAANLAMRFSHSDFVLSTSNWLDNSMATRMIDANSIPNLRLSTSPEPSSDISGGYHQVLISIPKGRALLRRWLRQALELLLPNGNLFLAGANRAGIHSVINDAAELFGNKTLLGFKKGNRISRFTKLAESRSLPDWINAPGIARDSWQTFHYTFQNHALGFFSLPGVFSSDQVDEGTMLLLENCPFPQGGKVLDFGCGCGVIGICAALAGADWVDLLDIDVLAIASAQKNLHYHGILNGTAFLSDGYSEIPGKKFDLIVSNPPFHTGSNVVYDVADELIRTSIEHLNPNGKLVLVANRFIRYERIMQQVFGNFTFLAQNNKYHLIASEKIQRK